MLRLRPVPDLAIPLVGGLARADPIPPRASILSQRDVEAVLEDEGPSSRSPGERTLWEGDRIGHPVLPNAFAVLLFDLALAIRRASLTDDHHVELAGG